MARSSNGLSSVERQVIAQIRTLRKSPHMELHQSLIEDPAAIMFHMIMTSHGRVELRIAEVARELGASMKKLQRSFKIKYKFSMRECQLNARLDYAKYLLRIHPTEKIAEIAAAIGYSEVRDFNHFFRRRTNQTPTEWMKEQRDRLDHTSFFDEDEET